MHVSSDERRVRLFGDDQAKRHGSHNGGGEKRHLPSPPLAPPPQRWFGLSSFSVPFFGVILPAGTILLELVTDFCAGNFYDPIPTAWHALLALAVPLINLLTLLAIGRNWRSPRVWLCIGILNAFAIAVAAFFTVVMLPISIIALIAVLAFGLGLLPLAPALSLVSAVVLRVRMRRDGQRPVGGFVALAAGVLLALAALGAIQFTPTITLVGLEMAASSNADEAARGLAVLRQWGDEGVLIDACSRPPGGRTDLLSHFIATDIDSGEARKVFYRVTGRPFNAGAARDDLRGAATAADRDLGADHVGAPVQGVSLASSRIDGTVDGDAATAYFEWTLVFDNSAPVQREARTQIALPPGGVVSRLTLWVDGEEREAAFGKRAQVRQAYQSVAVEQRRDPVLVTTTGPDRILLQCFPIPPGGQMRVRFGVTTPLQLQRADAATLLLPAIVERNFAIGDKVKHAVWLDGARAVGSPVDVPLTLEGTTARGDIADAVMRNRPAVTVARNPGATLMTVADTSGEIVQTIAKAQRPSAGGVVIVIDGSAAMREPAQRLALDAAALPGNVASVLVAGDTVSKLSATAGLTHAGGMDNVPALVQAWDELATAPNAVILWLHGPQPETFASPEALRQRFARRPEGPRLVSLQLAPGPNRIMEVLDGIDAVTSDGGPVPVTNAELLAAIERHTAAGERWRVVRRRVDKPGQAAPQRGSHVARLWAFDQVNELLRQSPPRTAAAVAIAHRYQLVTPATAAVVLETNQQFAQAGLSPVDANNVPIVPEPTVIHIALAGAAMWRWLRRRRRDRSRRGAVPS